jgi:hypothetical protein
VALAIRWQAPTALCEDAVGGKGDWAELLPLAGGDDRSIWCDAMALQRVSRNGSGVELRVNVQ